MAQSGGNTGLVIKYHSFYFKETAQKRTNIIERLEASRKERCVINFTVRFNALLLMN